MEGKVFVDTNVFLDLVMDRGRFGSKAKDFFLRANQKKVLIIMSISCIQTMIYVLEKEKYDHSKIRESMSYLSTLVNLGNTTKEDLDKAIKSSIKDLEDAILYYTAISNNCGALITQNTKDYPSGNKMIKILKPEEY